MDLTREVFAPVKKIIGVTAQDNTADSVVINGDSITVICMTGNLWINPLATAVANATALKLVAGMSVDLVVKDSLSLISDGSGASYQIVHWEV